MSEVSSSSSCHLDDDHNKFDDLDLGLGLCCGGGGKMRTAGSGSVQYVRILTAKDLPSRVSSSSSSSTSLCSAPFSGSLSKAAAFGTMGNADSLATTVSQVVGWPPVASYRMNNLVNQAKSPSPEEFHSTRENSKSKNIAVVEKPKMGSEKKNGNSMEKKGISSFIKVSMDGFPIGRKVDLNVHSCYEALAQTLEEMFCKPPTGHTISATGGERNTMAKARRTSKLLDGSFEFVLTYEDKDGDLMLVGDVPWGIFLNSVKKLRIMRACDANGLAPPKK